MLACATYAVYLYMVNVPIPTQELVVDVVKGLQAQ